MGDKKKPPPEVRLPLPKVHFEHHGSGGTTIVFDRPELHQTFSVYPPNYVGKIVEVLYKKRILSTRDLEDIFELK